MTRMLSYILTAGSLLVVVACGNNGAAPDSVPQAQTIAEAHNTLSAQEQQEGWMLLFDGKTPSGWRAFNGDQFPSGWRVDSGMLVNSGKAQGDTGGDLVYGVDSFGHFELSVDWKLSTGGNSGIFYHAREGSQYKAPYETAPEYQLIDDIGFPERLEPWQMLAADYAMYPADSGKLIQPAGTWNNSRIRYTAEKVTYWLNGKETLSFVPYSADWLKRRNSGKWDDYPDYAMAKTGYFALQDHGSLIWFRNIKARKLP